MGSLRVQWWVIGTCPFQYEAHRGVFLSQAWSRTEEVRYVHPLAPVSLARWLLDRKGHPLPADLGRWAQAGPNLHHTSHFGHSLPSLAKLARVPARWWNDPERIAIRLIAGTWRASEWLFGRWLRREMHRLLRDGVAQVVVNLCWRFSWSLRAAQPDLLIYDCSDNIRAYPGEIPERTDWGEGRLAAMSDWVVVSSFGFGERMRRHNADVIHIPNGVSEEVLDGVAAEAARRAQRAVERPVVVYHGLTMPYRFDWNLFLGTAALCPDYEFRIYTNPRHVPPGLPIPGNVRMLEWIPARDLPAVLGECSLGFMPYALAEPTLSGFPLKMFEYFAAGLPVVSTRLHEVERYASEVTLCGPEPREAAALIRREIEGDTLERGARRRALAEEHSWSSLGDRYRQLVCRRLESKPEKARTQEGRAS